MKQNTAYCVRCRKKITPSGATNSRSKNGRLMLRGRCPICDTKVVSFLKG